MNSNQSIPALLHTTSQLQSKLRISYRICIFRIIFVVLVMSRQDNFITRTSHALQPWNIMVYFLSGSVEIINAIAHNVAIRTAKKDTKTLKEGLNRPLKVGSPETYRNLYSAILAYKYKNKDISSAFKTTQLLHFIITFLLFGQMALTKQYDLQEGFQKQFFLWIFIILAYIQSCQLDCAVLQSSKGPKIKVNQFSQSKIHEIYHRFIQWRTKYRQYLIYSLLWIVVTFLYSLYTYFSEGTIPKYLQSSLFLVMLGILTGSTLFVIYLNEAIIEKAQKGRKRIGENNLSKIIEYDNLTFFGILQRYQKQSFAYYFILHRLIGMLCILSWLRCNGDSYFMQFLILGLFWSQFFAEYSKIFRGIRYKSNFLNIISYQDALKYIPAKGKVNDLPEKLQKVTRNSPNQCKALMQETVPSNQNFYQEKTTKEDPSEAHQKLDEERDKEKKDLTYQRYGTQVCSVCLVEYILIDKVVILPCGHIFHKVCIYDWLKLKQECPLCRLNLNDYYQK